jgi:phage N-6-adenine-methyltransferase
VCAIQANAKCERYFSPQLDGLAQEWDGVCFMNPPYGRTVGAWMAKALASAQAGATVVALVPARTDTAWWHDYATQAEIRYLRGRVRFGGGDPAPFPSAVVVFRPSR